MTKERIITDQSSVTDQFYVQNPFDNRIRGGRFMKINRSVLIAMDNVPTKARKFFNFIIQETFGFHYKKGGEMYRLFCKLDREQAYKYIGATKYNFSSHYMMPLIQSGLLIRIRADSDEWFCVNPWLNVMRAEFCQRLARNCTDKKLKLGIPVNVGRRIFDDKVMANLYTNFSRATKDLISFFENPANPNFIKNLIKPPDEFIKKLITDYYDPNKGLLKSYYPIIKFLIIDHAGKIFFSNQYDNIHGELFSLKDNSKRYNLKDRLIDKASDQSSSFSSNTEEDITPAVEEDNKSVAPPEVETTKKPSRIVLLEKEHRKMHCYNPLLENVGRIRWAGMARKQVSKLLDSIQWKGTDGELARLVVKSFAETYPEIAEKADADGPHGGNYRNWLRDGGFVDWLKSRRKYREKLGKEDK